MKTCEHCGAARPMQARVNISDAYKERSLLYKLACVLLIYLPLLAMPFVALSAWVTYQRLKLVGAKNLKPYRAFLPSRQSHRYTLKTQVTMEPGFWLSPIRSKLFWVANCTWYCPYSVALFEWHAYLARQP
jgi:hypothetical protein